MSRLALLRAAVIVIPLAVGMTLAFRSNSPATPEVISLGVTLDASPRRFVRYDQPANDIRPRVTNIRTTDLDRDGRADFLVCDAVRNTVWWHVFDESWKRQPLVDVNSLPAPARTAEADIDGDGDVDILVAILRDVWPTDSRQGQVIALLNDGNFNFTVQLLAEDLRRVTDVQPFDADGDGDVDLAVAEFGYLHGRVLWLENMGELAFAEHTLLTAPGAIHVPVDDLDGDGDPDIAAVISQSDERVCVFENTGNPADLFHQHVVWSTTNDDTGLAGMTACDLDGDGDTDFLLAAGDNLELTYPCPQPNHGCLWLENRGQLEFHMHKIATLPGTYATAAADLDADGDTDVVLTSMINDWNTSGTTSLGWLENDGAQNFTAWHIDSHPTHLCTVDVGDFDANGTTDIAAGSLQIYPPFDENPAPVSVWWHSGGGNAKP